MEFRPKLKAVVVGVGMALFAGSAMAGGWGAPSQGDSGQGVDTVIGNGLNVTGLDVTVGQDPNGLGPYRAPVAHTPTGQPYSVPWTEPESTAFRGSVEVGVIGTSGDKDAAKLVEYRDLGSGVILNNFNFGAEGDNHRYYNVFGGGVGREDQYYGAEFGVYNDWRVRGFYNETPHVFTSTARLIWNGAGTGYLALKQPLQYTSNTITAAANGAPANTNATSTNPAINLNQVLSSVVAQSADETIKLTREKGGIRFDKVLPDNWSFYVNATTEKRQGGRPWGQTGGGFPGGAQVISSAAGGLANGTNAANGQPLQMVEPIDYRSTEFRSGLSWAGDKDAFNASIAISLFQDAIKRVLWEDPDVSPLTNTTSGSLIPAGGAVGNNGGTLTFNRHIQSFTTPPDNQAYYLNLDYTHAFDGFWNAKLNSSLSYGIQKQDDQLQPYTSATGNMLAVTNTAAAANAATGLGAVNPLTGALQYDMSYWNSLIGPNGLPTVTRMTSGLENRVTTWAEALTLRPTSALSLNAKFNYYNFDQRNDYLACNPSLAAAYGVSCDPATSLNYYNTHTLTLPGGTLAGTTVNYMPLIYGFLVEDGGFQGLITAAGTGAGVGGVAHSLGASFRQTNLSFGGDYKISRTKSVNANVEEESVWRKERERDRTDEFKLKLGYVDRDLIGGTLRTSYEYARRTGTEWKMNGYFESACAALEEPGGYAMCAPSYVGNGLVSPGTNAVAAIGALAATARPPEGGKHDLNDRDTHTLSVRYNMALSDSLDFMVTGRSKVAFYPNPGMPIGLDERRDNTVSFDLNWQPSTTTLVYGYLTLQDSPQSQVSLNGNSAYNATTNPGGCSQALFFAGGCNAIVGAAGSIYNNPGLLQFFRYKSEDKNQVLGLGFSHTMTSAVFDGNYQYTHTRNSIDYIRWGMVGGALQYPLLTGGVADQFTFPDMVYDRQQLTLNVTVPLDSKMAVRGMFMYDKADVADWHYDGLRSVNDVTGAGRVYLDGGPAQSYRAQTLGVMLQYKM